MDTLQPVLEGPSVASPTSAGPAKFVALYGPPADPTAFERYYAETHVPLAHRLPGPRRVETAQILGTAEGGIAPYYRIAELWFDDIVQLQTAAVSAAGQALAVDVANFATGGLTVLVARADSSVVPNRCHAEPAGEASRCPGATA